MNKDEDECRLEREGVIGLRCCKLLPLGLIIRSNGKNTDPFLNLSLEIFLLHIVKY
jgi:hypothetical protein